MAYRLALRVVLAAVVAYWPATGAALSGAAGERTFEPREIVAFAKRVERALAERGARVVLVSRVGRPPDTLPAGIRYTHTGFAVYASIRLDDGRTVPGYAMYNLYQDPDDPDRSHLAVDYPVDFFSSVHALRAGVVIPTPALQQRLLEVVGSDTWRRLHNPRYSAISNPFDRRYQNCTEHLLDVINAAIYQTDDVSRLKAISRAWFAAQPVRIGPLRLLAGSLFRPDITTSDHDGPVQTATFTTIAGYLDRYGLVGERFEIDAQQ